jgi:hypothetical protein
MVGGVGGMVLGGLGMLAGGGEMLATAPSGVGPVAGAAAAVASLAYGAAAARNAGAAADNVFRAVGQGGGTPGDAFKNAQAGGRHAGFLKNYAGRSAGEIQRGITSIEKQIAEHQAKIANPEKFIEGWSKLDPRQQQALVNSKWPSDIQRQSEQLEILRALLGSR